MPVTQYQKPILNFAPGTKQYQDNYDLIDFTKKTNMSTTTNAEVAIESTAPAGVVGTVVPAAPSKGRKGRPKGSKNKKTIEKERLAALTATTEASPVGVTTANDIAFEEATSTATTLTAEQAAAVIEELDPVDSGDKDAD